MKNKRFLFFTMAILLGVGLGLFIGWSLAKPNEPSKLNMTYLRQDYKTDVVLMIAEGFARDADPMFALDQLARLDQGDLLTLLGKAAQDAEAAVYSPEDIAQIHRLLAGIDLVIYDNWKVLRGRHD